MTKFESLINNSFLYHPLRFSTLADGVYELLTNKTKKTTAFFNSFLSVNNASNLLAFDIGANKGNKTKALLQLGFTVIALEPEKKAISTLQYRYKNNDKVKIVEKGVSSAEGFTDIYITEGRSGLNTMNTKWKDSLHDEEENRWQKQVEFKQHYQVPLTTIDLLSTTFGKPYFIKIDVEGFELEVIKGMKILPNFLTFEANLPEFVKETTLCLKALYNLDKNILFNYSFEEKLILDEWISFREMVEYIETTKERYIEIICKKIS
jgi:FkbM family methyltransferase